MDKSIRTPNPKNTPITYPYYSSSRSNTPCHSSTHNRDVLSKDIGWRHDRRFAGYFFSFFFSFEFPYIIGVFLYFLQSTRQSGCVWNSGCATTSFWFGCCVAPIDQKPPCVGVPHRKGAKEETGDASPPPLLIFSLGRAPALEFYWLNSWSNWSRHTLLHETLVLLLNNIRRSSLNTYTHAQRPIDRIRQVLSTL